MRLVENRRQFLQGVVAVAVIAIAVGGFEHHHVGPVQRRGRSHQRRAGVAEVAGKHQAARLHLVVELHFDDRRAEDVPGVVKGHPHATSDRHGAAEADRPAQLERAFGVGLGIQRLDARLADPVAPAVLPLGVLFLDVRGVQQHEFQQFAGGLGGEDRALEALGRQARQQAAVVQVGVGDDHRVDARGIEGEGRAVAVVGFAAPLAHAAFEQDLHAIEGFQQITGASDLLGGA